MPAILIYSPVPLIARALAEALGEDTHCAEHWMEAQEILQQRPPSLLLLDASHTPPDGKTPAYLADAPGLAPCPLLLLTAAAPARAPALAALPTLSLPVRLAALRRHIHRLTQAKAGVLPLGSTGLFSPERRELRTTDAAAPPTLLTEKEAAILHHLLEAPNHAHTKDALLTALWGYAEGVDSRTLETHIYRLRGKLESLFGSTVTIATTPDGYQLGGEEPKHVILNAYPPKP